MKTNGIVSRKAPGIAALLLGLGFWAMLKPTDAQGFNPSSLLTNFTVYMRGTWTNEAGTIFPNKKPLRLSDFDGSIVFFDFFDPTCSSCQDAASWTATQIKGWYHDRKGNPNGIPVVLCSINIVPQDFLQPYVDEFVIDFRIDLCANDYNANYLAGPAQTNAVHDLFQPAFLKPVFLIINCVSNSPNQNQWSLMVNEGGEGADMASSVLRWRSIIDSVQAPAPQLTNTRLANGSLQFTFPGQRGHTNRVESSTDFVNWTVLTNCVGTNAPVTFRDTNAPSGGQRVYRVRRL